MSAPPIGNAARDYVRIGEWARARGLQLVWVKREESFQLINPSTRIALSIDSQEAEVNGVQVRLLFPVVLRDAQPCVSQLDLRTTFEPILSPPANRGSPIRTICLD